MSLTCAASSLAAAEPLAGTAVEGITTWLLVDVPDGWGRKGLEDTPLPEALRERIMRTVAARPWVRPQLIRRPGRHDATVALVVRSGRGGDSVEQLLVSDLDALASVDLEAWVDGRLPPGAIHRGDTPLVLVCAHGKRDRCCAEHGVALYKALDGLLGDCVWQSTHLNGHRFAATAVVFPGGWQYGRLSADDAAGMAAAIGAGHLYRLDRARGRTSASCAEQAAELAWRQSTHEAALGIPPVAVEPQAGGYRITVARSVWDVESAPSPTPLVTSCGAEPTAPPRWLARPHSASVPIG